LSIAWQRLFEDHLYWLGVYFRWVNPDDLRLLKSELLKTIKQRFYTGFIVDYIFGLISENMKKQLYAQGLGRHNEAELIDFLNDDINAWLDFLGDKQFMLGDKPSSLDTIAFPFAVLVCEMDQAPQLLHHLYEHPKYNKLIAYKERMKELYFPDWNNLLKERTNSAMK
jgi:hypothetical protein